MKTEFEFTLPRGYVDGEGNLHQKGWMRLARAKDTLLPLQDPRVKKNENYLILILLSRVVTRLGKLKMVNPPVIEGLFAADLAYLMEFYRRINEAPFREIALHCQACQKDYTGQVNLLGEW